MANSYIVLDGKQYVVAQTLYEPAQEKVQRIHLTVAGTHVSQQFFVDKRWGFDLRVPYTGDATWGSLADLKAAYAKSYVSFTDHYGSAHNVYFGGRLVERPDGPVIDQSAKFTVPVVLRKKQ